MFVPTYIQNLEVTPDYLILSKTQPTQVSLDFKNTFDKQADFTFYPYFSNRNPVHIKPGETLSVLMEISPSEIHTSPVKIGWISVNLSCFPLILPVCYVEKLPESSDCPVCFAPYNETTVIPKSIPNCGHSCCESCCNRLKLDEDTIDCPKCRTISVVRNGIRNLPRNFALLELLRNRELPHPPPVTAPNLTFPRIPCRQNKRHESKWFCVECESDYCQECFDSIHSAEALKNHQKYGLAFPICYGHAFTFADAVCTDASCPSRGKPVCIPCLECNHKLHQYESILKNMEENRKVLMEVRGALSQKKMVMERLEETAEEIKSDLALIQNLENAINTSTKSKSGIHYWVLSDLLEKATELCFKEYDSEAPPPSNNNSESEIPSLVSSDSDISPTSDAQIAGIENDVLETFNAMLIPSDEDDTLMSVEHETPTDSPMEEEELSQTVESIVDHLAEAVTESIQLLQNSEGTDDADNHEESELERSVSEGRENIADETHDQLKCDPPELLSIENDELPTATSSASMEAEAPVESTAAELVLPKNEGGPNKSNITVQEEQRKPDETENPIDDASRDYTAIRSRFNLANERPLIPKQAFKTNTSPKSSESTSSPENRSIIALSESSAPTSSENPNHSIVAELPSFKDRIAKFEEQNRLLLLGKGRNCALPTQVEAPVRTKPDIENRLKLTPPEEPKQPDETEKPFVKSCEGVSETQTKIDQNGVSENSTDADSLENDPESNSLEGTDPVKVE